MKKGVFTILLSMLLPMTMLAQSYSSLWKSVDVADTKDLQQDKLKALTKIAKKADGIAARGTAQGAQHPQGARETGDQGFLRY